MLSSLLSSLTKEGYTPYLTSVGGSGLGILSPYAQHRNPSQEGETTSPPLTPPETPGEVSEDAIEADRCSIGETFEGKEVGQVSEWAEGLGRWLFV